MELWAGALRWIAASFTDEDLERLESFASVVIGFCRIHALVPVQACLATKST